MRPALLCAFLALLPSTSAMATGDAGTPVLAFDAKAPTTWRLAHKLTPAARKELTAALTAKKGLGSPLTQAEVDALLDDARAQSIYGEKTVALLSPRSVKHQAAEHEHFLKVLLKSERVEKAASFFEEHRRSLEASGRKYQVRPEVVVSILMWESGLGTRTGDYDAFNVFTSHAFFASEASALAISASGAAADFDSAKQARRARRIATRGLKNLVALVRTAKAQQMDALSIKGSWAGALGYPQFMPQSLPYAEDGDGDGRIDLYTFPDSIASVARYLGKHGFKRNAMKAVLAYNRDTAYAAGVLAFADALSEKLAALEQPPRLSADQVR